MLDTQPMVSQREILDTRYSILDTRCSILNTRCSILDTRCSILDTRYSTYGVPEGDSGYWILDLCNTKTSFRASRWGR